MWSQRKDTNKLTYKTEIRHADSESKFIITKGEMRGKDKLGVWN